MDNLDPNCVLIGLVTFVLGMIATIFMQKCFSKQEDQEEFIASSTKQLELDSSIPEPIVLFFPDDKLPCDTVYKILQGKRQAVCRTNRCNRYHGDSQAIRSNLVIILENLSKATQKIDLCMYLLAFSEIADHLIYLVKSKKIELRFITDTSDERVKENNQAMRLFNNGVTVKTNRQNNQQPKMHNKFAIVDRQLIILGSANWTKTAIERNHESCLILFDPKVIRKFSNRFESMWRKFDPIA